MPNFPPTTGEESRSAPSHSRDPKAWHGLTLMKFHRSHGSPVVHPPHNPDYRPFSLLPLELREKIYTHAFSTTLPTLRIPHTTLQKSSLSVPAYINAHLPPWCFTNRSIHAEALLVYLRLTRLILPFENGGVAFDELLNYLREIRGGQGLRAVHDISIEFERKEASRYRYWADTDRPWEEKISRAIAFVRQFPALHTLGIQVGIHTIDIDIEDLDETAPDADPAPDCRPMTRDECLAEYAGLADLLSCCGHSLQRIEVHCSEGQVEAGMWDGFMEMTTSIVDRLYEEKKVAGVEVVQVEFRDEVQSSEGMLGGYTGGDYSWSADWYDPDAPWFV